MCSRSRSCARRCGPQLQPARECPLRTRARHGPAAAARQAVAVDEHQEAGIGFSGLSTGGSHATTRPAGRHRSTPLGAATARPSCNRAAAKRRCSCHSSPLRTGRPAHPSTRTPLYRSVGISAPAAAGAPFGGLEGPPVKAIDDHDGQRQRSTPRWSTTSRAQAPHPAHLIAARHQGNSCPRRRMRPAKSS